MKTKEKKYDHVLGAIYGTPWAITEPWLENIARIVEDRSNPAIEQFKALKSSDDDENESLLEMVGSVAIIPVMGPIFPRANLMTALSGATSSQSVSAMIDEAMDKGAKAVIFNIDSPGGAIPGGFEVANKIATLSIPTCAMIEGTGASLAYLWASQCDMVCCTQASMVGSVAVVMRMTSNDRAMKNAGTDVVTMKSGTLKQSGDPAALAFSGQYQSLLSQLQTYHDMFVSAIASKRAAKMDVSKIANGDVWIGSKAMTAGLVDGIATLDSVVNKFSSRGSATRKPSASTSATAATTLSATPALKSSADDLLIYRAAVSARARATCQGFYASILANGKYIELCEALLADRPFPFGADMIAKFSHVAGLLQAHVEPLVISGMQEQTKSKVLMSTQITNHPAGSREAWQASAELRREFCNDFSAYQAYARHHPSMKAAPSKGPAWANVETVKENGHAFTSYGGGRMTVAAFRRKAA